MSTGAPVHDAWRTTCAYGDALFISRAGAASWRARQGQRLQALLDHAARHSIVYRERLNDATTAQGRLQRLRPVHKRELMQRFADWVTDPLVTLDTLRAFVGERGQRAQPYLGRYHVWESSGSSGEPALFVQDEQALAVADALEAARGPISLTDPSGWAECWTGAARVPRIALVAATDGHFAGVVAFERARRLNPWLGATSRSFSFLQPMTQLIAQLEAFAPTVLACYPSMAWMLSEQQHAGRLGLELNAVWTGGETLTPAVRRTVSRRFDAPVRDSYGASECFLIANECRGGHLHLNADWVILEPVDEHGRAVPPGTFGATTLLTNLANRVQPIIRYDLGDRVRFMPDACACGSSLPVIDVQGRADDVLTLEDAHGHEVHLAPLALTTVLEDDAGVFDFVLAQHGPRALRLDVHGGASPQAAATALRAFLREQGLGATRVQCLGHAGASVERGRSGKQRRVLATPPKGPRRPRAPAGSTTRRH